MRWPMPVLAHYLLDAGIDRPKTVGFVCGAYELSAGDDDFVYESPLIPDVLLVGAYAIPGSLRGFDWPGGNSRIAADAQLLAEHYRDSPFKFAHLIESCNNSPQWVHRFATEAVNNPVAGYASPAAALANNIPLPLVPRPPGA